METNDIQDMKDHSIGWLNSIQYLMCRTYNLILIVIVEVDR